MTAPTAPNQLIRYARPGTLSRPGPLGRAVRLLMSAVCLWPAFELATQSSVSDLQTPSWWFLLAVSLLLSTYVINLGFGLSLGRWPRHIALLVLVAIGLTGLAVERTLVNTPLWLAGTLWSAYIFGHLGVSFLFASLIATPGCEMRAIPHLLGKVSGAEAQEHSCPIFIDTLDRWEQGRKAEAVDSNAVEGSDSDRDSKTEDLLRSPGRLLAWYGIPFIAIQLAGNFGGRALALWLPALAFLVLAAMCLLNAYRSQRLHCYFLGPWMLVAGVAMTLYAVDWLNFGPGTWPILVNTALAGGACISVKAEFLWGRYSRHS